MGLGRTQEGIYPHMRVGMVPPIQGDELDPHRRRSAPSRRGDWKRAGAQGGGGGRG